MYLVLSQFIQLRCSDYESILLTPDIRISHPTLAPQINSADKMNDLSYTVVAIDSMP